jgi:hypothetical protein
MREIATLLCVIFRTVHTYLSIYLSIYLFIYLSIYGSTALCCALEALRFLNPIHSRGDQPVARPLPIHRTTQTQNKRTQTSIPRVGFESATPLFEGAKTVHALDCAALWSASVHTYNDNCRCSKNRPDARGSVSEAGRYMLFANSCRLALRSASPIWHTRIFPLE